MVTRGAGARAGAKPRHRRSSPWLVLASTLGMAAAMLAGCSDSDQQARSPGPFAAEAEEWVAAFEAANNRRSDVLEQFYRDDAVVDARAISGIELVGDPAVGYISNRLTTPVFGFGSAWYVSDHLLLIDARTGLTPDGGPTPGSGRYGTLLEVDDGQVALQQSAWTMTRSETGTCDTDLAADTLEAYVAYWSGQADAEAPYAERARLRDGLRGVDLDGAAAIEAAAGSTLAQRPIRPARLEESAEEQVYPTCRGVGAPVRLLAAFIDTDPSGCPLRWAAVLDLDLDGRIVQEERLIAPESARTCWDTTDLERGWWEGVPIPSLSSPRQVSTATIGGSEVVLTSATSALQGELEWAFDRYDAAGLADPTVASVTWHDHQSDLCLGVDGYARAGTGAADTRVHLCMTDADLCRDSPCAEEDRWTRYLMLHELAHAWLGQHLAPEARAAFMERTLLRSWNGASKPHHLRGVERAADTIAFGLLDAPIPASLSEEACQMRTDAWEILTGGAKPLTSLC